VAEVVPEAERDFGKEQAGVAAASVFHGVSSSYRDQGVMSRIIGK
jgi:hypothetical protein